MELPKIILKTKKDKPVRRFHPWVFSGAIKKTEGVPQEGGLVEVYANNFEYLGTGHFSSGSIAVRILSFEQHDSINELLLEKVESAVKLRIQLGLFDNHETNTFRLVHAEGDNLPGLIIDWYNGTAVVQAHSIGMYNQLEEITNVLKESLGDRLTAIYNKSEGTLPKSVATENGFLYKKEEPTTEVAEYGHKFLIDWEKGQKTGFFIDQRENRKLLGEYSKGKKVLNTFCYTGGFSVFALAAGAKEVHSLDSSAKAIELTEQNVDLNGYSDKHKSICEDAIQHIKELGDDYDVIILDPPAFAKHKSARHNAVQGYKRLNANAIRQIKPGGIIFTFSCSQAIDKQLFRDTIVSAAISAGRKVRILHQLTQPADHPVNVFHPESEYLKGLVLHVE